MNVLVCRGKVRRAGGYNAESLELMPSTGFTADDGPQAFMRVAFAWVVLQFKHQNRNCATHI